MGDKVFEKATESLAKENNTALQILYGYAELLSHNDAVLDVIFKEDDEKKEIREIKALFEKYNIDTDLFKRVGKGLSDASYTEADAARTTEVIEKSADDSVGLVSALLSMNIPELDYVKNGRRPDDAFEYIHAHRHAEKPEEKAEPQKETEQEEKVEERSASEKKETAQEPQKESEPEQPDGSLGDLVKKTMDLYRELRAKVFGQNEAVLTFSRGYFQSELLHRAEVKEKSKPAGIFMFAGPPGVGKTYLAESAATALGMKPLRLDMAEYVNPESVSILIGYDKNYKNAKPGKLTDFVKQHPHSIVLFDEIEKASQDVKNMLLEILDGGRATDAYTGKVVDFKDTLLIFTSNAGKALYESHDRKNLSTLPTSVIIKAMSKETDRAGRQLIGDALLSRFRSSNLIMFNHLGAHELIDIIRDNFKQTSSWVRELYDCDVKIDKEVAPLLLFTQSNNTDARNISSKASMLVKNEIFEFARHLDDPETTSQIRRIHMNVDLSKEQEEVQQLFRNDEKCSYLYIGDEQDIAGLPVGDRCIGHVATDIGSVNKVLSEEDIDFILVDLEFGKADGNENFLSFDDVDTKGIDLFEAVHDKMPDMDIYVLEKKELRESDKMNFYENGAKGFISYKSDIDLAEQITSLCDDIYMQKQVDFLSGRSRVLTYNSSQTITDNGQTVEIRFYDLKERLVTDSEENKTLLNDAEKPADTFDDVIGADNAKKELRYFINYLKNPKAFMKKKNVKIPKGILLYGQPGTGKTMLARAMAGEANAEGKGNITFIPSTAAEFLNKYIGESASKVRELFAIARKFAPSILFIDEIDSVGTVRTGDRNDVGKEEALNQILTEMDGFEVNLEKPVFVVAATNATIEGDSRRSLDPALVRRFDKSIEVDLPTKDERKLYIRQLLDRNNISSIDDGTIDTLATLTTGKSLAILKNVIDSAMRTADEEGKALDKEIFLNALDDYLYGEKKEWDEDYYKSVAIHESGHAYLSCLAHDYPSLVTIVSRGDYGGYMAHGDQEDRPNYSKEDLLANIRTALAGRAAEIEFYGDEKGTNTGISGDLQQATHSAMLIICRYAMSPVNALSLDYKELLHSSLAPQLIADANKLISEQFELTQKAVRDGHDKIAALADFLVQNNQATGDDVKRIFGID